MPGRLQLVSHVSRHNQGANRNAKKPTKMDEALAATLFYTASDIRADARLANSAFRALAARIERLAHELENAPPQTTVRPVTPNSAVRGKHRRIG